MRRLLLGADGVAVRAGRHECRLDAFVAGLIALEKTLPWRRVATYGTAVALLAIGVLLFTAPDVIPGLTVPDTGRMNEMEPTDS